jgi:hypothetical protein
MEKRWIEIGAEINFKLALVLAAIASGSLA